MSNRELVMQGLLFARGCMRCAVSLRDWVEVGLLVWLQDVRHEVLPTEALDRFL